MDVKPITAERIKHLDRVGDARIVGELERIAHALYTEMELETLVRLDLRADDEGRLFVLEANPKPDLKARQGRTTSIIGESLDEFGMSYDDLILSLLADRIDTLFRRRRGSLAHVLPRADAPL
jgi:D-alanine-D-alanine ligase